MEAGSGIDRCIECKEPWVKNIKPEDKGLCHSCGSRSGPTNGSEQKGP